MKKLVIGKWYEDGTGIYELEEIVGNKYYFKEVLFKEEMSDDYYYGGTRILLDFEVKKLKEI